MIPLETFAHLTRGSQGFEEHGSRSVVGGKNVVITSAFVVFFAVVGLSAGSAEAVVVCGGVVSTRMRMMDIINKVNMSNISRFLLITVYDSSKLRILVCVVKKLLFLTLSLKLSEGYTDTEGKQRSNQTNPSPCLIISDLQLEINFCLSFGNYPTCNINAFGFVERKDNQLLQNDLIDFLLLEFYELNRK